MLCIANPKPETEAGIIFQCWNRRIVSAKFAEQNTGHPLIVTKLVASSIDMASIKYF